MATKTSLNLGRGCDLLRVFTDAFTGFSAQPASLDILHQKGRRTKFFSERFVQVLKNVQTRVESDQVHEFERTHGMVQSQFKGFIDVGGRGDAFLATCKTLRCRSWHSSGWFKTGRFPDHDDFFAHAPADFRAGRDCRVVGFQRAHYFK